jgi:hypothetical protein
MRTVLAATFLLLGSLLAAPARAQVEAGQTFTGTVVGVVDGDTYTVWRSAGDTVAVHLWGVDAPEPGQTYGAAATRAVRNYVDGKSARVSVEFIRPPTRRGSGSNGRPGLPGGDCGPSPRPWRPGRGRRGGPTRRARTPWIGESVPHFEAVWPLLDPAVSAP